MSCIITPTFIYLHPPKTGGRTVSTILKRATNDYIESRGHVPLRTFNKNRDLSKLKIIATVRNPFDRMVSLWYIRARHKGIKFIQFIESVISGRDPWYATKPQSYWLTLGNQIPNIILIRFEELQRDLQATMLFLDLPLPNTIPHINKTDGRSKGYRKYYKRCGIQAVTELYSDDLKLFGYRF